MPAPPRPMASAILLLLAASVAAPASAQPAAPDAAAQQTGQAGQEAGQQAGQDDRRDAAPPQQGPYWDAIRGAIEHYRKGRWAEARAAFERAHGLRPGARTLRGVGLAAFEMGDAVAAARAFEGALAEQRAPLAPAQRREVERLLERLQPQVGRVALQLVPGDAALEVDGEPVALPDDGELLLSPGRHAMRATRQGHRDATQRLELKGGETTRLRVALEPLSPEPAAAPRIAEAPRARAGAAPPSPTAPAPRADDAGGRLWTWVALGVAAVSAGTAAGLYLEADSRLEGIVSECTPEGCDDARQQALIEGADLETYETGINLALGLSAAAAAGALVLFFVEGDERPAPISLGPDGARLRVRF